jgi:hypothetical protein
VEHGLRLALELCASSITYRSRYLAVLQPAPALDLMLADDGNPRGLAFQLAAMRAQMNEIGSGSDGSFAAAITALQDEPQAMVRIVSETTDQLMAALTAPAPPVHCLWCLPLACPKGAHSGGSSGKLLKNMASRRGLEPLLPP